MPCGKALMIDSLLTRLTVDARAMDTVPAPSARRSRSFLAYRARPSLLGAIWLDLKRNKIETVFAVDETIFRASL
jgi:hypothetical protein